MSVTIKQDHKILRKNKIRSKISGTSTRPRLTVFISNMNVSAQLIDDEKGITIASSTTVSNKTAGTTMTEKAVWVGADIAKKALAKKVKQVVFDRNGKLYHGRVAALADSARNSGLEL